MKKGVEEFDAYLRKWSATPGTHIQWCPDLVYPDLVDCRDLVD